MFFRIIDLFGRIAFIKINDINAVVFDKEGKTVTIFIGRDNIINVSVENWNDAMGQLLNGVSFDFTDIGVVVIDRKEKKC